jgi:spermidine synthase
MNWREKYDLIFADAYNDLSIPYHLTTREFAQLLRDRMNPGGILLTNIIDNFQRGAFLPSYIKTLREVFGERNIHVVAISPEFDKIGASTFIVLAGKDQLPIGEFEQFVEATIGERAQSAVIARGTVDEFIANAYSVVLRDDYAPVDNLIAPVFEERFGYNRRQR